MNTTKLTFEVNMALNPTFCAATLMGESTIEIFPKFELATPDEDEKYIHADLNIYWEGPDGVEPDPFAEICFEVATERYSFGLLEYDSLTCSKGVVSDPGGWEVKEYSSWFTSIRDLAYAMMAAVENREAQEKAILESEAVMQKTFDKEMQEWEVALDTELLSSFFTGGE